MVEDEHHFTISANAFLKRMVRSLVGTLVDVGRGRLSVAEFGAAFKAADRRLAGKTAPPQGLVLTRVHFDNEMDRLFENLQDPFAG
jgi:tRNA pseudouridine38-40 synthase